MLQEKFSLENLKLLYHGEIEKAFANEVKYVVLDCEDRPLEKKARTVTIQFVFAPEPDTNGNQVVCDNVNVACDIKSSIPTRKTRVFVMKPKQDGSLAFHPDDPNDPDADMLYDGNRKAS